MVRINFPKLSLRLPRHLPVRRLAERLPKLGRRGEAGGPPLQRPEQMSIQDILAPKKIEIDFDYLKIEDRYFRSLFVSGYPRFVSAGWLDPIINFDHSLDISFFIYPVESRDVLDDLRRKIAEMEAEIATDLQRGKVVDPGTQAKLEDAQGLQEQLVKGAERVFQFSFYITIPAENLQELNQITQQVESTLGSLLIIAKHTALQMEDAFQSTLPLGADKLYITRNMDTTGLATTFPFTSAELSSDTGVLYGINEDNDSLVVFDRFSLENYNSSIMATSGAGKSLSYNDIVLYKDKSGQVKLEKIGEVVERQIRIGRLEKIDKEMEGTLFPDIEVFAFDKFLKGKWSKVSVAARKLAPKVLYKIKTRSGREVTVTADHNLVVLKDSRIKTIKGNSLQRGNYIPIPRAVKTATAAPEFLDTRELLKKSRIKFLKLRGNRVGNRLRMAGNSLPWKFPLKGPFYRMLGYFVSEGMMNQSRVLVSTVEPIILKDLEEYYTSLALNYSFIKLKGKVIGIHTHSEPFRELLRLLEATGKAGKKKVPSLVFSAPNQAVANFLRAYFEGDGGVEQHEISATTKSKNLASDLAYLLLRFGIVARIGKRMKVATNTKARKKKAYYRITISGQENIRNFTKHIGFISKGKNKKARKLLKKSNTNIDTIPELGPILKEVYTELYSHHKIGAPRKFSEIKLGIFRPSRQNLLKLIEKIEERVKEIESLEKDGLLTLQSLPTLDEILARAQDKKINRQLWQTLSSSWPVMKNRYHPPLLANALAAASVTHGQDYDVPTVSSALYKSLRVLGESTGNRTGNMSYVRFLRARNYILQAYTRKRKRLQKIKNHLTWLKILAQSHLFWDEVVETKKIKSKHKYVYDLTVDDQVFLAGFGGMFVHNSFSVKLEAVRSLMLGTEVFIIDPESEYEALANAVGGEFISFSFNTPAKINPFDLSGVIEEGENQLGLKVLSLHALFAVIMGKLDPSEEALLDRALIETYKAKGITPDPETQTRQPPLMEDLYKTLLGMEDLRARGLADRIEKFVKGSFRGIFDQHTNIGLQNPFTVFSVRDLEEALRPIAMFVILDFIWTRIKRNLKKRLLIVDEAWHMMRYPDTAQFLYSVAKRSRKYWLGLTTITQDVEDFLTKDIGKAIVTNSSLRLLMKQSPAAIDTVGDVFKLSEGEKQLLLAADIGEGIFFAGANHVAIRIAASEEEYKLITSKPEEVVALQRPRMVVEEVT